MRLCERRLRQLATFTTASASARSLRVRAMLARHLRETIRQPDEPGRCSPSLLRGERVRSHRRYRQDDDYRRRPGTRQLHDDAGGARTAAGCAAAQGRCACSASIALTVSEVRPFTDKQIALLAELRGAGGHRDGERAAHHRDARGAGAADRDRRGAAGHQSSPGDLAPVFDAMLEKATRLVRRGFGDALHLRRRACSVLPQRAAIRAAIC